MSNINVPAGMFYGFMLTFVVALAVALGVSLYNAPATGPDGTTTELAREAQFKVEHPDWPVDAYGHPCVLSEMGYSCGK